MAPLRVEGPVFDADDAEDEDAVEACDEAFVKLKGEQPTKSGAVEFTAAHS